MSLKDMTGHRSGRLTVTGRGPNAKDGSARWHCVCECGGESLTPGSNLRRGTAQSCGCLVREMAKEKARRMGSAMRKHGHAIAGTYLYRAWSAMKTRCSNPNCPQYPNYGGRGIRVAKEWVSDFAAFARDVGERPSAKHTLDRINVDGDYAPGNVRWATQTEQNNNTRRNRFVEYDGQVMSVSQACRLAGLSHSTVWLRLRAGWSLERAFNEPSRSRAKRARGPFVFKAVRAA